ncbi:MAG: ribosome small subunit-dependent GTPase A [Chloroflexota bacterium]
MTLKDLGFTELIENYLKENNLSEFTPGRVTQEHRERYIVSTGENEYDAEITGNMRFTASSRTDFPAVGDWVAMKIYEPGTAIIHHILPRKTVLERQSISRPGEKQIISANVDAAFIVQSIDANFSINRLERYMTVCNSSGIKPILVISKVDLADESRIKEVIESLHLRHPEVPYILLNNFSKEGPDKVAGFMKSGHTYCVAGSSGTGKSTLINNLLGRNVLKTTTISESTGKGRHTTEHRELFILDNGAIVIDTPGMRELGVTENPEGVKNTFKEIHELAMKCKFPDCTHRNEKGCEVIRALDEGLIDRNSLDNYLRLLREQEHFSETIAERRKKDREFGKMAKRVMKEKKKTKG